MIRQDVKEINTLTRGNAAKADVLGRLQDIQHVAQFIQQLASRNDATLNDPRFRLCANDISTIADPSLYWLKLSLSRTQEDKLLRFFTLGHSGFSDDELKTLAYPRYLFFQSRSEKTLPDVDDAKLFYKLISLKAALELPRNLRLPSWAMTECLYEKTSDSFGKAQQFERTATLFSQCSEYTYHSLLIWTQLQPVQGSENSDFIKLVQKIRGLKTLVKRKGYRSEDAKKTSGLIVSALLQDTIVEQKGKHRARFVCAFTEHEHRIRREAIATKKALAFGVPELIKYLQQVQSQETYDQYISSIFDEGSYNERRLREFFA